MAAKPAKGKAKVKVTAGGKRFLLFAYSQK
jgi:hypothetical protein